MKILTERFPVMDKRTYILKNHQFILQYKISNRPQRRKRYVENIQLSPRIKVLKIHVSVWKLFYAARWIGSPIKCVCLWWVRLISWLWTFWFFVQEINQFALQKPQTSQYWMHGEGCLKLRCFFNFWYLNAR